MDDPRRESQIGRLAKGGRQFLDNPLGGQKQLDLGGEEIGRVIRGATELDRQYFCCKDFRRLPPPIP